MTPIALALAAAQMTAVTLDGSYPCQPKVNDRPVTETDLGKMLMAERRSTRRAVVHYTLETPWRCFGGVMSALQRARFRKIVFDPPLLQSKE